MALEPRARAGERTRLEPSAGAPDAARARAIAAVLDEPDPPLPVRVLQAVAGTATKRFLLAAAIFVVGGIFSIRHFIDSNRPKATERTPAIEVAPGGRIVPVMDFQAPEMMARPPEMAGERPSRGMKANVSLEAIAGALRQYAADHDGFPAELSQGLPELSTYGDFSRALDPFEDGKLATYTRSFSKDMRQEIVVLEARVKGTDQVVRTQASHWRKSR